MKNTQNIILFLLLFCFSKNVNSQRICGSVDYDNALMHTDPNYKQNRIANELEVQNFITTNKNVHNRTVVTIPVVVHVVYNLNSQNISDAQIQSQITTLNQDFRKLNLDFSNTPAYFQTLAADCEIQFCLATRDPNGVTTNGITRTLTTTTVFTDNNAMKYTAQGGQDAWDRNSYLNLWVCKLTTGLLGYAQFPGGAAASDGVVISYKAFGNTGVVVAPYNKGRTATHEIGHWLDLFHIWGDDNPNNNDGICHGNCNGSDLVGDTPNQCSEHLGCPTYPQLTACTTTQYGEMFMNYMDYTDDACMTMFSAGQKARMVATLNTSRSPLLNSIGCLPVTNCGNFTGIYSLPTSNSSQTIFWNSISGATSYKVDYKLNTSTTWNSFTVTTNSVLLPSLLGGSYYDVRLMAYCSGGASNYSSIYTYKAGSCVNATAMSTSTISNITNNSAVITWPVVNGGIMVAYNIFYKKSTSNDWNIVLANTNSITLNNLEQNNMYNVKIQLVCLSNPNSYSDFCNFNINGAPLNNQLTFTTLKTCNYPITELEAWNTYYSPTNTNVGIAWKNPINVDITNLNVEYKIGTASTWSTMNGGNGYNGYGWAILNFVPLNTSFTVRVNAVCNNQNNITTYGPYSSTYNFYTANNTNPQCTDVEPNDLSTNATTITVTQGVTTTTTSKISILNDIDYFKIVTTNASPKLKLRLKNLALNYKLSLYDASLNLLTDAFSSSGLEYRDIIYNDATVGATYYVKVYPNPGTSNYDNNVCYRLLSNVSANEFREGIDNSKEENNNYFSNTLLEDVTIYPNPANENLNIVFNSNENCTSQISLFDLMGQKTLSKELNINIGSNTVTLNVNSLSKGIYYLNIINNSKKITKKIIIE